MANSPPPRRCAFPHACRQVFGLAGLQRGKRRFLISAASQPNEGPVLLARISFLFTAAGQFRILTGFPFSTPLRCHRGVPTALITIAYIGGMRGSSKLFWQFCPHQAGIEHQTAITTSVDAISAGIFADKVTCHANLVAGDQANSRAYLPKQRQTPPISRWL